MSELTDFRRSKDEFLKRDHHSPLTDDQQRTFAGLSHYDENPGMRFELDVKEFDTREIAEMETGTGAVASYLRWGRVAFDVDGESGELTLYRDPSGDEIFLPFADATSSSATYGAGHYIDTQKLHDGRVLVDFNCAYNEH